MGSKFYSNHCNLDRGYIVYIFQLFDFRGSSWKCNCRPTDYGSFGFNRRHRTSGVIIFRTYHCSFGEAEMGHSHFRPLEYCTYHQMAKKNISQVPRKPRIREDPARFPKSEPMEKLWKNVPQKPKSFWMLNRFHGSPDFKPETITHFSWRTVFQPFLPGVDPVFEGWTGGCPAPPRRCSWHLEKNHQKSIGFGQTFWRAGAATSGLGEFDFGNWLCRIHHYYICIYINIICIYIYMCVYLYFLFLRVWRLKKDLSC